MRCTHHLKKDIWEAQAFRIIAHYNRLTTLPSIAQMSLYGQMARDIIINHGNNYL
jgi:tetrahydromethanopterin S-methyltransferase subunit C